MRLTQEEFEKNTNWNMTYDEYCRCYCPECARKDCVHRDTFRRVPVSTGGLSLCPNLNAKYKLKVYETSGRGEGNLDHEEYFDTKEELDDRFSKLFKYELFALNPTAWEEVKSEWIRLLGY